MDDVRCKSRSKNRQRAADREYLEILGEATRSERARSTVVTATAGARARPERMTESRRGHCPSHRTMQGCCCCCWIGQSTSSAMYHTVAFMRARAHSATAQLLELASSGYAMRAYVRARLYARWVCIKLRILRYLPPLVQQ